MVRMANTVQAFLVLAVLISLLGTAWSQGFRQGYDLTDTDTEDGQTVFEKLEGVNLLTGIDNLRAGFDKLSGIKAERDLLGGAGLGALGVIQVVAGIVTFPFDLFGIVSGFYVIPPILGDLLGLSVIIAIAFVLIQAKLRTEI